MILRIFSIAIVSTLLGVLCVAQNTTTPVSEIHRLLLEDQRDRTAPPGSPGSANMGVNDVARRKRAHELLDQGVLQTGVDFFDAALIFQHGDKPEDYLLAHILAMVAVAKGNMGARELAAVTLDRYLQSIDEPQVFGTQNITRSYMEYLRKAQTRRRAAREATREQQAGAQSSATATAAPGGSAVKEKSVSPAEKSPPNPDEWVQSPYNASLISDSLRAQYCVIGVEEQKKETKAMNAGTDYSKPRVPGC